MSSAPEEIARWRACAEKLERTQWELERRIFQLETLVAMAREASACHDLLSAARTVLNVLAGTFGVLSGAVLIYDIEADVWMVGAVRGLSGGDLAPEVADPEALRRWIASHRAPSSPADLTGAGLDALAARLGRTTAAVPVLHHGEMAGLILLGETLTNEPLGPDDLELCAAVASSAAHLFGDILATERYLQQQQERFRVQGIFEQYCAPDVVERLLSEEGGPRIGMAEKVVTVLMADIRGFTELVQRAAPSQLADMINGYLTTIGDLVFAYRGTVDNFMGDAVMAVFGDPYSDSDDALRAVRCAMETQERLATLFDRAPSAQRAPGIGIGVTTGAVLCGTFGSPRRFTYTVIGPPVNLAARLSEVTHSGEILIDEATYLRVRDAIPVQPLSPIWMRGFSQPLAVYRVHPPGT